MRIGVFGGSFDPVHLGHLRLAECCQAQAGLDRVLLVPAAHQPHKAAAPRASGSDRLAMLRLAIAGRPGWEASSIELDRGGPSFTIDTLRALRAPEPTAELFFLLGADALADLPRWREAAAICEIATPLAVHRAGAPAADYAALESLVGPARADEIRRQQVDMPAMEISSSDIRRRIAVGEPWQSLVPAPAADYIVERGLYRRPSPANLTPPS